MNADAQLAASLFAAINRRRSTDVMRVCAPEVSYQPVAAELTDRGAPYRGLVGIERYFAEVERTWDELVVTPRKVHRRGDELIVAGRIFARGHRLGMRDLPAAWVLELEPAQGEERPRIASGTAFGRLGDAMRAAGWEQGPEH